MHNKYIIQRFLVSATTDLHIFYSKLNEEISFKIRFFSAKKKKKKNQISKSRPRRALEQFSNLVSRRSRGAVERQSRAQLSRGFLFLCTFPTPYHSSRRFPHPRPRFFAELLASNEGASGGRMKRGEDRDPLAQIPRHFLFFTFEKYHKTGETRW